LPERSDQFHTNISQRHFRQQQHGRARGIVRKPNQETRARHFFAMLEQAKRDFCGLEIPRVHRDLHRRGFLARAHVI
jgi:hypothetical protein